MKNLKYLMPILIMIFGFMACNPCEEVVLTPCDDGNRKIDLIVLIDNSSSMGEIALSVSNAAIAAIDSALASCPSDLRVEYLALEGTWPTTVFNQSQRTFIFAEQGGIVPLKADAPFVGYGAEQGANGIEDLSKYTNWRDGACRAIFYISDEELDSTVPLGDFANEDQVTLDAIAEANLNEVTVFTHFVDWQNRGASIINNYNDLSNLTGGQNFYSTSPNVQPDFYVDLMPQIVCNSCKDCTLGGLNK